MNRFVIWISVDRARQIALLAQSAVAALCCLTGSFVVVWVLLGHSPLVYGSLSLPEFIVTLAYVLRRPGGDPAIPITLRT